MAIHIRFVLTVLLASLYLSAFSQFDLIRNPNVPVIKNKAALANPWAGGLTAGQVSHIDVNGDGLDDLFIFDRDGNRVVIFVNESGSAGDMNYRFAPEYTYAFPPLRDWVLLRDFDGDGDNDIFTSFQSSVQIWENTTTPESGLQFALHTNQLSCQFDFGTGPNTFPLVCLSIDIPSIIDYDGDGDLDIVTFTESASTLYFFTNRAAQNGDLSTFDYVCTNRCYGMFEEGAEDNSVFYGDDFVCPFNVADPRNDAGARHAGGTLLSLDLDGNGILDLLVGDSGFNTVKACLMEDAVDGQDSTAVVDPSFPSIIAGETPLDLYRFPASYHLDVNNDGVNDLIFAPNSRFQADDDDSMWLYLNTGTNEAPWFELETTRFLQAGMIETGTGAYPVLADVNGDGLLDLIIANREYYVAGDAQLSQIALYLNVGTSTNPVFEWFSDDWNGISATGWRSVYPSFGDLDGDGDLDMIIGEQSGQLHVFTNNGVATELPVFDETSVPLNDNAGIPIDIGQFATPYLFDIDNDGDLDLLVGEKEGIVNLFLNTGTANTPVFTQFEGDNGTALGGVQVQTQLGINGYSIPQLHRDNDGALWLFVGNEIGGVEVYNGFTSENFSGSFNQVTTELAGIKEGLRCGMALDDINNDGYLDMVYGITNGGVMYFRGYDPSVSVNAIPSDNQLKVYPNPANDYFVIERSSAGPVTIRVSDITGKTVIDRQLVQESVLRISTLELGNSIYLVEVYENGARRTGMIVVNR
ncbi:MAG: FG-GAP-like repeat-containing protein [Flavobacteriales bacterium]